MLGCTYGCRGALGLAESEGRRGKVFVSQAAGTKEEGFSGWLFKSRHP